MFFKNEKGNKEFLHGREADEQAKIAGEECHYFFADDEDEHVSEYFQSCYNCRYRRWTSSSFVCLKV